jgi:heterodisulfide reductase subunit D
MSTPFQEALENRLREEVLDACVRCGKCAEACPMLEPAGVSRDNPVGLLDGVLDLLQGGEGTADARRWTDVCTGSGYCISACEYGVNPRFMVKMAGIARKAAGSDERTRRSKGVSSYRTMSNGVRLLSRLQMPPEVLERVNPMSRTGHLKAKAEDAGRSADIVFYTGCNILKTPHIALLCLDVLDALGKSYEVMGGPSHCCGVRQFNAGDLASNQRFAFGTIDKLGSAGTAEVLSWCPSCQIQLGEISLPNYRRETGSDPFDLQPFILFLDRHLDELRSRFAHRVEKRVALHERPAFPQVMAAIKRILTAVPGVELVELPVHRASTMANHLDVLPVFKQRLRDEEFAAAAAAGVTTLATVYHACHREICHYENDVSFEIINFMEIVGEAMGLHADDLYKRLKLMGDVDAVIADSADLIERYGLPLDELRDSIASDMFPGP